MRNREDAEAYLEMAKSLGNWEMERGARNQLEDIMDEDRDDEYEYQKANWSKPLEKEPKEIDVK